MNEKIRRYMYTHNTTHTHAWNSNICRLGTHGKRWEVERESESDQHHLALMHIIGIHMHTCTLRNAVRGCLHIQVSSWEPPKAFRFLVHFFLFVSMVLSVVFVVVVSFYGPLSHRLYFFSLTPTMLIPSCFIHYQCVCVWALICCCFSMLHVLSISSAR